MNSLVSIFLRLAYSKWPLNQKLSTLLFFKEGAFSSSAYFKPVNVLAKLQELHYFGFGNLLQLLFLLQFSI